MGGALGMSAEAAPLLCGRRRRARGERDPSEPVRPRLDLAHVLCVSRIAE
jgi:hypothetical protein